MNNVKRLAVQKKLDDLCERLEKLMGVDGKDILKEMEEKNKRKVFMSN